MDDQLRSMLRGAGRYSVSQIVEKGIAGLMEAVFELLRAIAIATRPRLFTVRIAAVSPGVGVFHAQQFEVAFPIGALFGERR